MAKLKFQIAKPDWWIAGITIALVVFGLLAIFEASTLLAQRDFGDKFFYLKNQLLWAGFGLAAMVILAVVDYRILAKLAPILLLVSVILLIIVLVPGLALEIYGARRRFELGPIIVQPGELVKLTFLIFLSSIFAKPQKFESWSILRFLLPLAVVGGLIILEPDLGTAAIVVLTSLVVFFVGGATYRQIFILFAIFAIAGVVLIFSAPYRAFRLQSFLNPNFDPLGQSYQINQILIGVGSGGLFGVGLGESKQKFEFLPEAPTDSIFAVIAEELGFAGAAILILGYLTLVYRGFKVANLAADPFGRLLATGITSWIGVQTIINLGSQLALIPLTGVPLPFVSYGGSALVTAMAAAGIILNISVRKVKLK